MNNTQSAVRDYFRAKRKELMALSELPVCAHPGLTGGHREQIYRSYLSEILPRRYSVGRGMVYDTTSRSRESDIVIWDSSSYPSLPMLDHSFFFAESVKGIIECKSRWSQEAFDEVFEKCCVVHLMRPPRTLTLEDHVVALQFRVDNLQRRKGKSTGFFTSYPRISTFAIFLRGGGSVVPKNLIQKCPDIEFNWPDVVLFLEPGLISIKTGAADGNPACINFYKQGDASLLAFSIELLRLIDDRTVLSDSRFYLDTYALDVVDEPPIYTATFKQRFLTPGRYSV